MCTRIFHVCQSDGHFVINLEICEKEENCSERIGLDWKVIEVNGMYPCQYHNQYQIDRCSSDCCYDFGMFFKEPTRTTIDRAYN